MLQCDAEIKCDAVNCIFKISLYQCFLIQGNLSMEHNKFLLAKSKWMTSFYWMIANLFIEIDCGMIESVVLVNYRIEPWVIFLLVGKLGHGDTNRVYKPKIIETLSGVHVRKVACGSQSTLGLTSSGQVGWLHSWTIAHIFLRFWMINLWKSKIIVLMCHLPE